MTKAANKFACGFCKKAFRKEGTLTNHMCIKKRRYLDRNSTASLYGLDLYNRWYEMNTAQKSTKTIEDFINSQYYTAFIKFARKLMDLKPDEPDRYRDYVFSNEKLKMDRDWCKDKVYEAYLVERLAKEPAQYALERSIQAMGEWSEKYGHPVNEFFIRVSPSEITHMIRMGKISPWVLYLSERWDWDRLSSEQYDMIESVVDPTRWMAMFQRKKDDCDFVRDILKDAHI